MNPGDNFAVVAGTDPNYLAGITRSGTDLKDSTMTTLPVPPDPNPTMPYALLRGARSEMLTIWRKLHIEIDSMGNVGTVNNVTGKISAVELVPNPDCTPSAPPAPAPSPPCNPNFTRYSLTKNDGSALGLEKHRFENGRIVIGNRKFIVLDNKENSIDLGDTSLSRKMQNKSFILYDDDDYNADDGGSPDGDNNESLVQFSDSLKYLASIDGTDSEGRKNILASAYIMPEYNWADLTKHYDQKNLTFELNVEDGINNATVINVTNRNRDSKNDEKADFWISYFLIGYQ